jgi:uncharacterized membrane protein (DUF4010 family)
VNVGAHRVFSSAAVLGLTDVDALTVSMAKDVAQSVSPSIAAAGIGTGVLSNTGMKIGQALSFGTPRLRMIAAGSFALLLVAVAVRTRRHLT